MNVPSVDGPSNFGRSYHPSTDTNVTKWLHYGIRREGDQNLDARDGYNWRNTVKCPQDLRGTRRGQLLSARYALPSPEARSAHNIACANRGKNTTKGVTMNRLCQGYRDGRDTALGGSCRADRRGCSYML